MKDPHEIFVSFLAGFSLALLGVMAMFMVLTSVGKLAGGGL